MWCDSHCHVPYSEGGPGAPPRGPDLALRELGEEAVEEARRAGVARLVSVGTDAVQSLAAIAVAEAHDDVWATVGLHPHEASRGVEELAPLLRSLSPRVVAIGECGLDYHYDLSPRPAQREAFAAQVGMARRLGLALVVHTRSAWDDTFAVLRAEGTPERTIFHCFTGGPDEARRCLDIGAYLSFSGIVSFKNATDIREAAALCPLDRLLVETDSPYLAPVPLRGKRNSPANLPLVGAAVAVAKGLDVGQVESASWDTAARAFGLG
jgi:TatD DNase family protein